jgi:hypothetical protein
MWVFSIRRVGKAETTYSFFVAIPSIFMENEACWTRWPVCTSITHVKYYSISLIKVRRLPNQWAQPIPSVWYIPDVAVLNPIGLSPIRPWQCSTRLGWALYGNLMPTNTATEPGILS